jgi:hypothetical protein
MLLQEQSYDVPVFIHQSVHDTDTRTKVKTWLLWLQNRYWQWWEPYPMFSSCTWHKHIFAKRLEITLTKMYWLLGHTSNIIYKTIFIPIWTYGIQLWGTASTSNIHILERFQSKALRIIVHAPWYMPNTVIWRDLQIPTVEEEICRYSPQYSAHPNDLIVNLMEVPDSGRLQRHLSNDLPSVICNTGF